MALAELLRKLTHREQEQQRAKIGDYRDLIRQAAADTAVDEEEAAAVLHAAGKNAEDLARDVQALRLRGKQREIAERGAAIIGEIRETEAAISDAEATAAKTNAAAHEFITQAQEKLRRLSRDRAAAEKAELELIKGCGDAELVERLRELTEAESQTHQLAFNLKQAIRQGHGPQDKNRTRITLQEAIHELESHGDRAKAAALREELRQYNEACKQEWQEGLATAEAELRRLKAEIAEVRAAMVNA